MKTLDISAIRDVVAGSRFVSLICNKIYKLVSPYSEAASVAIDREHQFAAYVNNRICVLTMWVRAPRERKAEAKYQLLDFLHDMEHHFVDPYVDKKIRFAFKWIRTYVRIYPIGAFKKNRSQKAYEMIRILYEGLNLDCKI